MTVLRQRSIELADDLAVGGDTASASDVWSTAYDDTALNRYRARFNGLAETAYDREIARLKALTGADLVNPYRYTKREMMAGNGEGLTGASFERFEMRRQRLAEQRPDLVSQINAGQHTLAEIYKQQKATEKRAEEAIDASPLTVNMWLLGKVNPVAMGAGMVAAFEDPIGWVENLAGFGGLAGRGARGILMAGAKAGAANAGITAAVQPLVQSWRQEAGLEFGLDRAAQETLMAGLVGFGLDAGVRSGIRGVQRVRGREIVTNDNGLVTGWRRPGEADPRPASLDPMAALDEGAARLPPDHPVARAAAGDDEALLEVHRATGGDADPELRGAAQELERFRQFGPPPEVDPLEHYAHLVDAIQRAHDPEAAPPGAPDAARPVLDPTTLSPELLDAHNRLVMQEGSPLDMAAIMRFAPELVDGSLHLSDHKTKQAVLLAKLSDDAFEMVAGGEVSPNHAAVVARHVADAGRHVEILNAVAKAGLKSEAQVKMLVGEMTSRAGAGDVHANRTGAQAGVRELAAERAKVLDGGVKALLREPRVAAVIEAEAARLEAALPEGLRGDKKLRSGLGARVAELVQALSHNEGVVSDMIQEAALSLQRGVGQRPASRALAARIADIVERDGLSGLAKSGDKAPETLVAKGFSDPVGPEAKAQMDELASRIKLSLPDDGASGGKSGRQPRPGDGAPSAAGTGPQRGDAGNGGIAAGGQPGPGRGASSRRDAGPEGRPIGAVGNFTGRFGDERFTGTVVASRDFDGLNHRTYWLHEAGKRQPGQRITEANADDFMRQMSGWVSTLDVFERRPGVWEVGLMRTDAKFRRQHLMAQLHDAIELDVGGRIDPSGNLMPDGYAFYQRRNPDLVRHHRFEPFDEMYLSPKVLTHDIEIIDRTLAKAKNLKPEQVADYLLERQRKADLLATVPAEARSPQVLANSFSLADPRDLQAGAVEHWPAIRNEIEAVIGRLPVGVRARIEDRLVYRGRSVEGSWDPHEALVEIAMGAGAGRVARHEEVHVLRDLGAFTDAEWDVVAARAVKLFEEYNVEGRWREFYEERYPNDPARVRAALIEEAVAEMRAHGQSGARFGGMIDAAFKRISEMLERIANFVRGRGLQSVDDIFRRIDTGEMGRRTSVLGRAANENVPLTKFSLKALPHETTFDHLGDWLGIDPHRIVIDAEHIAAKRKAHNAKDGNAWRGTRLTEPTEVVAFVRHALGEASFATKYKVRGDGDTYNLRLALDDGTYATVSIDTVANAKGEHLIRTAFPASPEEHYRALAGSIREHGELGLRAKGDPAALESLLAHVSEAQRAAPGHVPDSVVEVIGQQLARARELRHELKTRAVREAFEAWANDQLGIEADKIRAAGRPGEAEAVEAQRMKDLGEIGEVCKS